MRAGWYATCRDSWRTLRGVTRSLRTYYGNGARRSAMDGLYGQFVRPGDLVFDVGAHVGDRIASFRRLGARVVALEPQPALVRTLRLLYGRDRGVAVEPLAVGRETGTLELRLNVDNPTVSTASIAFVQAARGAPGWEGQAWTRCTRVPVTTLDALVARHGSPAFIKIDVEGFEAEALAGLTRPPPALSFEFTTIQRERGGRLHRPLPRARLSPLQRDARRKPCAHPCRLARRRRHAGVARRLAARSQFGRRLRAPSMRVHRAGGRRGEKSHRECGTVEP